MDRVRAIVLLCSLLVPGCGADGQADSTSTRQGYLVDACPWQAFPSLPELGEGCFLDVFLSPGAPHAAVPAVCAEEPFMSLCSLDRLGHAVDPTRFVVMSGTEESLQVCSIDEKTPGAEPSCAERRVFVPLKTTSIEASTGATP